MNITSEIKIGHCHFIKNSEIVLAFIIHNYVLTQIWIVISDGKVVFHSLQQKFLVFKKWLYWSKSIFFMTANSI